MLIKAICVFPEMAHALLDKIHTKYQEDKAEKLFFKELYDKCVYCINKVTLICYQSLIDFKCFRLPVCTLKTISFIYTENMQGMWREVSKWFFDAMRQAYVLLKSPENQEHLENLIKRFLRCPNIIPFSFMRFCILSGDEFAQHIQQYSIANQVFFKFFLLLLHILCFAVFILNGNKIFLLCIWKILVYL